MRRTVEVEMPDSQQSETPLLLSIGQARRMLGVSEATLRHWTDEGRLKAFITPGGHRRYQESELRQFMESQRHAHGMNDLLAKMELVPLSEMQLAKSHFANAGWYINLSDESRAKLRLLGGSLFRLAIDCLTRSKKPEENMQSATDIGREFGKYLAEIGVSLTDSLEAFLLHRTPFVNAINDMVKGNEYLKGRAAEALPLLAQITDRVLLSMVESYQGYHERVGSGKEEKGSDDIGLQASV